MYNRSPLENNQIYSQIVQKMISARKRESKNVNDLQKQLNQRYSQKRNPQKPMTLLNFTTSVNTSTPERRMKVNQTFDKKQNEIMRMLSRPSSSNNSQQKFILNQSGNQASDLSSVNMHQKMLHSRTTTSSNNPSASKQNTLKKKLLNESKQFFKPDYFQVLRSTQSNMSTSYLINTLKDKIGDKINNKHRTMESIPTFIQKRESVSPSMKTQQEHNQSYNSINYSSNYDLKSQLCLFQTIVNQEITIMKQQLDTSTGVKEFFNNLEDRERTMCKQLQMKTSIFTDLRRIVCNSLQKQEIEILHLKKLNTEQLFKEQTLNKQVERLELELNQQQKDQSELITLVNTLRQQQQQSNKQDECQDTYKYPHFQQQSSYNSLKSEDDDYLDANPQLMVSKPFKKGITLNLNPLQNGNKEPIGYHDEFMANINEFSESWRQQALAEKRF